MSPARQVPPDLSHRTRRILYAVITEYIGSGEPVASRKLAKRYGLGLSPATIRNVLADLEELGLLAQPHTSAGRIPTDLGFRLFVDALVEMREVTTDERSAIMELLHPSTGGTGRNVLERTGRLLSSLTGAVTVIAPPRLRDEPLEHLRFMPLNEGAILAILVTKSGAVQNRVVPVAENLLSSDLERINNFLAELIRGESLTTLRGRLAERVDDERAQYINLKAKAAEVVEATASLAVDGSEIMIQGRGHLFERPEFEDADKLRRFLKALEEQEGLLRLLDQTLSSGGVQVLIGSETNLADIRDVSLISTDFAASPHAKGALGIIGPTRMDYGKLVPLLRFTAASLAGEVVPDEALDEA